jgi:hypothetical protein
VRYRDRQTGQLVSKSTWTRSKAHGGTRYVRESAKPNVMHLITVTIKSKQQRYSRDLLVPARKGTSLQKLLEIADNTLPKSEIYVSDWLRQPGVKIKVATGPRTRARKASLR